MLDDAKTGTATSNDSGEGATRSTPMTTGNRDDDGDNHQIGAVTTMTNTIEKLTTTEPKPPTMMLPQWMYRQIISDDTVKAVWCYCGAPALTYCNGLQFVCHGGGHFGVPMKSLKPRPEEQAFVERQCSIARELERAKYESGKPCKQFRIYADAPEMFCLCGFHFDEHKQRKERKRR